MSIRKLYVITALFIAVISSAHAQGIEIGFVIPTNQDEISVNTARILRSRILPAFTAEGIETSEVSSIAIKPELSSTNYQEAEGGMRNIHTSEVQINLICQNLITGTVFASRTFSLQGQGYSADDLVKSAFSQIKLDDENVRLFLHTAKRQILSYYSRNLRAVLDRAQTYAQLHQYEEALSLLFSCPSTLANYNSVNAAISNIYKQYQRNECGNLLLQAQTEYSNGNYEACAEMLKQIDTTSPCATEAKALCQRIKQSRDTEAKQIIALIENQAKREADLEKQRIKAARDIAVAYYKQHTNLIQIF